MTKQQRIILISVIAIVVILLGAVGGYYISVYSSASGERTSGGFTYEADGRVATIISYNGSDTKVTIPAKIGGLRVNKIAKGAFANTKVTDILFDNGISQIQLEEECFKGLTSLVYVELPDALTEIPASAFEDCTSLTHVAFSDSITSIGDSAFEGCSVLAYSGNDSTLNKITLPQSLTTLGQEAFMDCPKINSVVFGDKLTQISKSAFEDCSNLTSVSFGDNSAVSTISDRAFYGTRLNSYTLPSTLTRIGDYAFYGNTSSLFTTVKIPASVNTLGEYAFAGCTYLKTVEFEENSSLVTLGAGVFQGDTYLNSIKLPEKVTKIPSLAFNGCSRLVQFEIGAQITEIGAGAFGGIANDSSSEIKFTVNENNKNFVVVKLNDYYKVGTTSKTAKSHYLLMDKGMTVLHAYIGQFNSTDCINNEDNANANSFNFILSADITKSLRKINSYAFDGLKAVNICIPQVVTEVGEYCFNDSDIKNVYFESNNCSLDSDTFKGMQDGITVLSLTGEGTISDFVDGLGSGFMFGVTNGKWPD